MTLIQSTSQIINLAIEIDKLHNKLSDDWLQIASNPYHFKKNKVNDVYSGAVGIDLKFIQYILEYTNFISNNSLSTIRENPLLAEYLMDNSRVKNTDSIKDKLYSYKLYKKENGKVNLNKCLNDLVGFRIIVKDFEPNDINIATLSNELDSLGLKITNASKGEYKAIHIYFQKNKNVSFPWELQIWSDEHQKTNLDSHIEYKPKYISWPRIHFDIMHQEKEIFNKKLIMSCLLEIENLEEEDLPEFILEQEEFDQLNASDNLYECIDEFYIDYIPIEYSCESCNLHFKCFKLIVDEVIYTYFISHSCFLILDNENIMSR